MKRNKGFTLMELVIVIAIIAVLLLILVPIMNGYIGNAQRTTCEANRKIVETDTKTALLLDHEGHTFQQIFTEQIADKKICPCGGKISYIGDANNFTIICSEHSTMQSIKNLGDPEVMKTLLDIMATSNCSYMDSTAIAVSDVCEAAKALRELEAAGVDLSSMNVGTWHYDKRNNFFFWTEEDIVSMRQGATIPVMRYNGKTGTYTVWYATVRNDGSTATSTETFTRFVVGGSVPASNKDTEQTYETCYEIWKNTPIK